MRLVIFGASGGTGRQLVRQALEAGHHVTAVVRGDPEVVATELTPVAHEHLSIVRADVMDPAEIEPILAGQDAVLSALGHRGGRKQPTTVCADGVFSVSTAMDKAGVTRLIVVSADGAFTDREDGPMTRMVVKPLLQRLLEHAFADGRAMEELVRDSGLDWTIIRPPRLTNGSRTRNYRTAVDKGLRGGFSISRADLADCILGLVDDPGFHRTTVSIGY